jgi:thiol-disulfide isomerase/thioredoxin
MDDFLTQLKNIKLIYLLLALLSIFLIYTYISNNNLCEACPKCDNNVMLNNNNNIKKLTQNTQNSRPKLIKVTCYHASWCGHCKSFMPTFLEYKKRNTKNIKITSVQCDGDGEQECARNSIKGYPTVLLEYDDNTKKIYEGDRSLEALLNL